MTALEVHDVSVRFGGHAALQQVALTADAGTITGLIGPNGAGKTTLFNVICGLHTPTRGSIRIGGVDVTKLPPFRRARLGLARTFQRLELFGLLTVHENVRLAARASGHPAPDASAAQILERLDVADLGSVRADRLPTGQARVVELARALATNPRVLLLDEPASGQDQHETATFSAVLREVADQGVAVVLVEHDVHLVMDVCSRIHVLELGRILATGTPSEVANDPRVLAAYLGSVS